jgi:hypothetical protein
MSLRETMTSFDWRFRQIHLDFHTSEHIPGIGADFDPEIFAGTLVQAHVDSVTCFARCHHGWIYFDTQRFPERKHPQLERNLLKEQIAACRARGIRVPIYITVQWDHYTAYHHPEWLVVDEKGNPVGTPIDAAGFYRSLCLNSPYVAEFLQPHVQEVVETLPTDGIFFDILLLQECSCRYCREGMRAAGLEPTSSADRRRYGLESLNRFKADMTRFVRRFNPDCTIFYNAGHVGPRHRAIAEAYTHFEIESLPSGGWGYVHFPTTVRYARTLKPACLGMTGKFHSSWGDFHSFKNRAALEFECFQMLALNARCSVGDQLHPRGRICQTTYDLIGPVYAQVEQKEPWCRAAQAVTEVGVLTPEEFSGERLPQPLIGAVRMLEEAGHQFDVLDSSSDFSAYKVLVLPDQIRVSPQLASQLQAYLVQGGGVIASYEAGLDPAGREFALPEWGVRLTGLGPCDLSGAPVRGRHFPSGDYTEYLLPRGALGRGLPETEHAMHIRGLDISAGPGAQVLVNKVPSYFDRTHEHFCSHRQTPSAGLQGGAAIVRCGQVIYFANPIFTQYARNAARWCKQLCLNALDLLLPEPLLRHGGPSTLRAYLNAQMAENRWVMHLLHYIPERRGQDFDVIEDVIPLADLTFSLRVPAPVQSVTCVPAGSRLDWFYRDGRLEFTLPQLLGHQMIALQFNGL